MPLVCCHSSGPEQPLICPLYDLICSVSAFLPPGVMLRWELRRLDVWGRTYGVETKCMLSLYTICSGMQVIVGEERCFWVCASVLPGSALCPYNCSSTHHKTLFSLGMYKNFPGNLSHVSSAVKCGHTLPLVQTGHGKPRCSLYILNQSRLPRGSHPYMNNMRLK